jgi:glycosyltransferase involved in cell wall biosynthesis
MPTRPRRIAIIHDWCLGFRGGEQVLDALFEIYPEAELFTLFYKKGSLTERIENRPVHVSFLNKFPLAHKYYRHLLPLMPMAIERFDLSGFDLIISNSHCVAKGIIPPPNSLHICYSLTPMRYAWDKYKEYFGGKKAEKLIFPFTHYLRIWDHASASRVDHFVALSHLTAARIRQYYRREASVIYPHVEFERFHLGHGDRGDYYLMVSALVPYKRFDIAIEACERLGRKLLIVGGGPEEKRLRGLAKNNTVFLGRLPNEELSDLLASARAFLYPGEEDFGIAPIEAMASGTPVIAYNRGGAIETVVHGKTGILFEPQTVQGMCDAILEFERWPGGFQPETCRTRAYEFRRNRFVTEFRSTVEELWEERFDTRPNLLSGNTGKALESMPSADA